MHRLLITFLLSTACLRLCALDGLDPRDREGLLQDLNNCAWALATDAAIADGNNAVVLARLMTEVGELPLFMRDTIAACHARAGDKDSAVRTQTEVVKLAREKYVAEIGQYQKRLELFQNGTAFTELSAKETVPFERKNAQGGVLERGQVDESGAVGRWNRFFAGGTIEHTCWMRHGQRTGRWERWRADGKAVENGYYYQNRRLGFWNEYQAGGKMLGQGIYHELAKDDQGRVGRWYFWDANGHVACQGNYVGGQRQGLWEFFSPDGRVLTAITYRAVPPGFGVRDKAGEMPTPVRDDAKVGADDF